MRTFQYTVTSDIGFHTRPAAIVTRAAEKFESKIMIRNGEIEMNGKSLMGLIALKAVYGDVLEITVDGPDEEEAQKALIAVFDQVLTAKQKES